MSTTAVQELESPKAIIRLRAPPMKKRLKKVHSKVKSGCALCRQRRVKCGEQRPSCLQCTKGGRTCPGYQKPKVWLFESFRQASIEEEAKLRLELPPSSSPFQNAEGYRAFQYYFEVSEPPMARFFSSAMTPLFQHRSYAGDANKISTMFWTVSFPRLVCAEPVIARCLLVLVTSHEKVQISNSPFALVPECLEKFIEAITLLRREWNNMSVDCILITSLVLAIAELSFGPSQSGLSHLYAGSRIIKQRREHPGDFAHHRTSPEIEGIRESIELLYEAFFTRIDRLQTAYFSNYDTLPTNYHIPKFWLPLKFSSTQQALGSLESITMTAQTMIRKNLQGVDEQDRISLRHSAERWLGAFQDLEEELNCTTDPEFQKACLIIRISGLATLVMANLPTSESVYDNHEAEFRQIAEFAEEFLKIGGGMTQSVKAHHVYGVSPVNPIFFAACKCRRPALRKRLLQALRRLKVAEGLWTSCSAYQIAKQVPQIEETAQNESSASSTTSSPIVRLDGVTFDSPDFVTLKFYQQESGVDTGPSTKTVAIQSCRHQTFLNKGKVLISEFGIFKGYVKAADCECDELYTT